MQESNTSSSSTISAKDSLVEQIKNLKGVHEQLVAQIKALQTEMIEESNIGDYSIAKLIEIANNVSPEFREEAESIIAQIQQIDLEIVDLISKTTPIGGSNPGGVIERIENGKLVQYYLKYKKGESKEKQEEEEEHLKAEFIAGQIYRLFGVKVPTAEIYRTSEGRLILLSEFITSAENPKTGKAIEPFNRDLRDGFIIDILLGNYDIYTNPSNIVDTQGGSYRVDNGSSLLWRARGSRRSKNTDNSYDSFLRDPEREISMYRSKTHPNWMNGVLKPILETSISEREIKKQVKKLSELLTDEVIDQLLENAEFNEENRQEIRNLLISRRDLLIERYLKKPTTEQGETQIELIEKIPEIVPVTLNETEVVKVLTSIPTIEEFFSNEEVDEEFKTFLRESIFYKEFQKLTEEEKERFYKILLEEVKTYELKDESDVSIDAIYFVCAYFKNFENIEDIPKTMFSVFSVDKQGSLIETNIINEISEKELKELVELGPEAIDFLKKFMGNLNSEQLKQLEPEVKRNLILNIIEMYKKISFEDENDSKSQITIESQTIELISKITGIFELLSQKNYKELEEVFFNIRDLLKADEQLLKILANENYIEEGKVLDEDYLSERISNLVRFEKSLSSLIYTKKFILKLIQNCKFKLKLEPNNNAADVMGDVKAFSYSYLFFYVESLPQVEEFFNSIIKNESQLQEIINNPITYFKDEVMKFAEKFNEWGVIDESIDFDYLKPFLEFISKQDISNVSFKDLKKLELIRNLIIKNSNPSIIRHLIYGNYSNEDIERIITLNNDLSTAKILIERFSQSFKQTADYGNYVEELLETLKSINFKELLTEEEYKEFEKNLKESFRIFLQNEVNKENTEIKESKKTFINYFILNIDNFDVKDLSKVYTKYIWYSKKAIDLIPDIENLYTNVKEKSRIVDALITFLDIMATHRERVGEIPSNREFLLKSILPRISKLKESEKDINKSRILAKIVDDEYDDKYLTLVYQEFFILINSETYDYYGDIFNKRPDVYLNFLRNALSNAENSKGAYLLIDFLKAGVGSTLELDITLNISEQEKILLLKELKEKLKLIIEHQDQRPEYFKPEIIVILLKQLEADKFKEGDVNYFDSIILEFVQCINPLELSKVTNPDLPNKTKYFVELVTYLKSKEGFDIEKINSLIENLIDFSTKNLLDLVSDEESEIKTLDFANILYAFNLLEENNFDVKEYVKKYLDSLVNKFPQIKTNGEKVLTTIDPKAFLQILKKINIEDLDEATRVNLKAIGSKFEISKMFVLSEEEIRFVIDFFSLNEEMTEIISILCLSENTESVKSRRNELLNLVLRKENPIEKLKTYIKVYEILDEKSFHPRIALQKHNLFNLAIESEDPVLTIYEILQPYLNEDLPDFAIRYLIFNSSFIKSGKLERIFNRLSDTNASVKHKRDKSKFGTEYVEYTVFLDLFRTSIETGETSLLDFLTTMKEGIKLVNKINLSSENEFTTNETLVLERCLFLTKTLILNSPFLTKYKDKISELSFESNNLESMIEYLKNINKVLRLKEGENLISLVSRYYLRPLGFRSIDEAIIKARESKRNADERNRALVTDRYTFEEGDILKSVEINTLSYILGLGFYGREFVGTGETDRTPLDHDGGEVRSDVVKKSFREIYLANAASQNVRSDGDFGKIVVIIKPGNKYRRVKEDEDSSEGYTYNRNVYEVVDRHVYPPTHVGIRTASPSTDISILFFPDFFGTLEDLNFSQDNNIDLGYTLFQVSNNGFYIPILNGSGGVIFNETHYEQYKIRKEKITTVLTQENLNFEELFEILELNPFIKELLNLSSGTSEGFSIKEHTKMVMRNFEEFLRERADFSFISKEDIRLLLLSHDIGKGWANKKGEKNKQHEYTNKVFIEILKSLEVDPRKISLFLDLIDHDLIGDYLTNEIRIDSISIEIKRLAKRHSIDPKELLEFMIIFYKSDAGAYSSTGGSARGNLNHVFEMGSLNLSSTNETKIEELRRIL